MVVNVQTGSEQTFSDARFDLGGQLAWLGDGSALMFDAVEQAVGRWSVDSQLRVITYPAGSVRRITRDVASYTQVSATADGRALLAVREPTAASCTARGGRAASIFGLRTPRAASRSN